jgi:hypothetical protein
VTVQGALMIGVALAGVVLNPLISLWLHAEAKHDLNVRSAYLRMVGDAVSALGVVAAGVVAVSGSPTLFLISSCPPPRRTAPGDEGHGRAEAAGRAACRPGASRHSSVRSG